MDVDRTMVIPSDKEALKRSIRHHLTYSLGKAWSDSRAEDVYLAVALAVRDRAMERRLSTERRYLHADAKRLYYLSMEFLIGRLLSNSLYNLGLWGTMNETVAELGFSLEELCECEKDAGLGNGGLGRLAACFLESMATLHLPGFGYGLYYEYGLFKQEIEGGYQRERPDRWQGPLMPWGLERSEEKCLVPIYGRIVEGIDRRGEYNPMWLEWRCLVGVPHDMPVIGWGGRTVNTLRLYSAEASDEFDMQIFNEGDYIRAVEQKMRSETVSRVLYPSDTLRSGKELRLVQEYFFVACSIRDIVNRFRKDHADLRTFPDHVAIQLNDTHPALAIAELMRVLVDERGLEWEGAWDLVRRTFAYTNHTLLPEALEKWPVSLMESVVPRHLQIIYEINRRFLDEAEPYILADPNFVSRVSLVEEGAEKQVRMANLAIVGSHSVNGVAALHSELIKTSLVPDFFRMWPERFNNKTNGVTPRRWIGKANPPHAALLDRVAGESWITDLDRLRALEPMADDPGFQAEFRAVKRIAKERLARTTLETCRISIDPGSLFDVHAKRIHEYKRQLLNILHVVHLYLSIVEDGATPPVPRTFLFAGKAAPSYWTAKMVIKLIHVVADAVNGDPRVRDLLRVVFLPDYRVSLAERIIPAADLSEQISTAGTEASGTGNMKFAMNGALTIGTLDGANVEIREAVGEENIFIFGKTAAGIEAMKKAGSYRSGEWLKRTPRLARVLDALSSTRFAPGEPGVLDWVRRSLVDDGDRYFVVADFEAYRSAQQRAGLEYTDASAWTAKAIRNVARMGPFSSDRAIRQYADEIWSLSPVP